MALNEKLDYLQETKNLMKQALIEKGQEVPDDTTFRQYIEKIIAIKGGDDLQEQLDNQDEIIQQLQAALENKTGGPVSTNIFMQEEEPSVKNGIWIKNSHQYTNKIAIDTALNDEGAKYTKLADIPYDFYDSSAVLVDTDIHLFGSLNSTYSTYHYKYDTLTDEYTRLTDIPDIFYRGSAILVGTDIHLFGVGPRDNNHYKYDTLTSTYIKLADMPYPFSSGSAVLVGTDIHLLGSSYTSYGVYHYKYDTLTNTYTRLADIPYGFTEGSVILTRTSIYLLGSHTSGYTHNNYEYSMVLDAVIPNDSLVIEQGNSKYRTEILVNDITNGLLYKFSNIYLKDEEGNVDSTTPVYYGNGEEWIKIGGAE